MKKTTLFLATALSALMLLADGTESVKMNGRRLSRIERAGGWVTQPSNGKIIRIINAQKRVPRVSLEETAGQIGNVTSFPVVVTDSDETDPAKIIVGDTAAAIIVKDSAEKERITVAPEDGWSVVNVRAIGADGADEARVTVRTSKEVWRAAAMMLGASDSMMQPCLMAPIHSIADLDANTCVMPTMEPFNKMINNAKQMGVAVRRRVSYRKACQEGWAPEPTNAVQKAIWNEIHVIPDKPLTIEFDPKKDM